MKPNEYIKKYNLKDHKRNFNHDSFVADLTIDFTSLIEYHRQTNWNYSKFKVCVDDMRSKFDAISRKTAHPKIHENLWKYFYATVVCKYRDEMFGDYLKKQRENREREKEERDFFSGHGAYNAFRSGKKAYDFYQKMFEDMLYSLLSDRMPVPITAFAKLQLSENSNLDDIKKRYKELAFKHHPDRGGNAAKFREITEAKNRCIAYITKT